VADLKHNKKNLCLFTSEFPFGESEAYIESEIPFMAAYYGNVYIFPAIRNQTKKRELPPNFEVIFLADNQGFHPHKILFGNFSLIVSVLFRELYLYPKLSLFLKDWKDLKNIFIRKIFLAGLLETELKKRRIADSIMYSYWFSDWILVLGILKYKGVIGKFYSRAHGFDVYEERHKNKHIPFRYFHLKMVETVFSVSKKGSEHLKQLGFFSEKVRCSYLGVPDNGSNPFNENGIFSIVSCSNIIPLKRIHLIVEILSHLKFAVKWLHFGDGEARKGIEKAITNLPANIDVELRGQVSNSTVLNFYTAQTVNLFINVSETEGLPMTLIEACSFGIPMIATDVGGNREIVSNKTGILIPANFNPEIIAEMITNFKNSKMNSAAFRKTVKSFWAENFYDKVNYTGFYKSISK
jgi:glycosyltransferase involved in cell wall biosynthesis